MQETTRMTASGRSRLMLWSPPLLLRDSLQRPRAHLSLEPNLSCFLQRKSGCGTLLFSDGTVLTGQFANDLCAARCDAEAALRHTVTRTRCRFNGRGRAQYATDGASTLCVASAAASPHPPPPLTLSLQKQLHVECWRRVRWRVQGPRPPRQGQVRRCPAQHIRSIAA